MFENGYIHYIDKKKRLNMNENKAEIVFNNDCHCCKNAVVFLYLHV